MSLRFGGGCMRKRSECRVWSDAGHGGIHQTGMKRLLPTPFNANQIDNSMLDLLVVT